MPDAHRTQQGAANTGRRYEARRLGKSGTEAKHNFETIAQEAGIQKAGRVGGRQDAEGGRRN